MSSGPYVKSQVWLPGQVEAECSVSDGVAFPPQAGVVFLEASTQCSFSYRLQLRRGQRRARTGLVGYSTRGCVRSGMPVCWAGEDLAVSQGRKEAAL